MINHRWEVALKRLPADKKLMIAEVGVWTGRMTQKILESRPNAKIMQIDRWQAYTEEERIEEGDTKFSNMPQIVFNKAYWKNKNRIERNEYLKRRVRTIVIDSISGARLFKKRFFDMIFLDAGHSYKACHNDILAWIKKVKKGGWIGGHDYPDRPGVKQAVDEIFGDKIETDVDKTWWVKI